MTEEEQNKETDMPEATAEETIETENAATEQSVEVDTEPVDEVDDEAGEAEQIEQNQEAEKLKEQVSELKDSILRERAEFANYRKRVSKEKLDIEKMTAGKIVEEMLPALDSFDQILSTDGSQANIENYKEGVVLIRKQLWAVFEKFGVEEFNPEGEEFDPNTMEALSMVENPEVEKETVQQVFQKGYRAGSKMLRAARVVVARPVSS